MFNKVIRWFGITVIIGFAVTLFSNAGELLRLLQGEIKLSEALCYSELISTVKVMCLNSLGGILAGLGLIFLSNNDRPETES